MFNRNPKFVRDMAFFIILFQFLIGIGVAAYQFTESSNDIDEMRTDDNLILDPNKADYVDVNTSDVDGGGSQGSHSNFPEMQATNDIYDTLTENEAITPPLYYFVDNNSSDVDGSSNLGSYSNFTAMQYGPDSSYDNLTEVNTAGLVNTTFINAESFEGTWTPSGWSATGNWNNESNQAYDGIYSADFDGSGNGVSGYLTTNSSDCSDAIAIYVEFYFYDNGLDENELWLQYYDGNDWDYIKDLNTAPYGSDGWHFYSEKITDNQYFISNFQIRWRAYDVENFESAHADMVTIKKETPTPDNYELNLEVQFTGVPDFLETETLCIYAGSFNTSEDIGVYEWDGSQWQFLGNLTASSWNNFTISYLTSTNYTIKYQGWNETGDSEQSSWQIDSTLLRLEGAGQNETAVDNDTSDVDSSTDLGALIDFSNMTTMNGNVANLTESVKGGSLDCTGGYMIIGDGSVDWSSTAGTISFWIKFDTIGFGRPYGQHGNMELRGNFFSSNLILDWGESSSMTTATTFSADMWYFIAVVWDETSNDLLVYIGTDLAAPTLDINSLQGTWTSTLPTVSTSYFMRGVGESDPVDGHGQDLRYFDIARSQSTIQTDYKHQLTGSEPNLVNYYKLTENFADSAGTDDGSGSGSCSFVTEDYVPLTYEKNWGITTDTFAFLSTIPSYRYIGGISPNIEGMSVTKLWIRCGSSGIITIALYTGGSLDDPTGATKRTEAYNVPVSAGWNAIDVSDFNWPANTVTWIGLAHDCSIYYSSSSSDAGDFQSARGRWDQDSPPDADETSPMPSSPGSGSFSNFWYAIFAEYTVSDSNRLDQEVQWTGLPYQLPNEEICIYCGTLGDEDILVDVWNGTSWENLFSDLTANSWNNFSIASYLDSSTFTIRFRDGNTTGDTTNLDNWEIDVALIHIWQEATSYKLDLEVQWTSADFDEYFEELCIKTGTIDAEDISVDVWDGSQWQEVISDLNPSTWNNVSVTSYLTSSTFTIRVRDGSESSDTNQGSWQIDAVLLHTWTPFDSEPPNILWGTYQIANDTGTHQVHIDIDAEDIYYGADIEMVWYRILNISASDWVSGYNNVSLTSPIYETNVDVSNWHPSLDYYVEAFANDTLGNENSTQNINGDEYRYFTIVHSINVSQPTVFYSGGSKELDISDVTATCSYAAHGTLEGYSEAIIYNYTIYTNGGSPTGISGDLVWTGSFWQVFDVDVSSLSDGTYYVTCSFEDSDGSGTSSASNTFTITSGGGDGGGGGGNGDGDGGGGGGNGDGGTSLQIMILSIDYPSQTEKYSNTQIDIILTDGEGTLVSGAEVTLTIDNGTEPLYLELDEKEGYYTALLVTDTLERGNHTIIVSAKKTGFETLISSAFSFEIIVSYPLLTIIQHPSYAPQVIQDPIQLLIDPTFYISISLILASVMIQKITFAPISSRKLRALYIFTADGKCVYDRTFTIGGVGSQLMTAALSGIISLIMEATNSETPTRTVDQGEFDILLEYGPSIIIATFVEKRTFNKRKIRKSQNKLVKKIEKKYGTILVEWDGNLQYFQEMDHLVLDAFDFKVTKDLVWWINNAAEIHEQFIDYYTSHRMYQMAGMSLWKAYDLYVKIQSPKVPKILAKWIALGKTHILDYIIPITVVRNMIVSIIFRFLDFVRTPFLLKAFHKIQSTVNPENSKKSYFFN